MTDELMDQDEFTAALDGIFAYDTGSTDSGIKDDALRARLLATLIGPDGIRLLSVAMRDLFLTDEALDSGYSVEDVAEVLEWIGEHLLD